MAESLELLWSGRLAGRLSQDDAGAIAFQYAAKWLADPQAAPLSARLPLRPQAFDDAACRVFFANLLPEGNTRALVARKLGLSESNDFKLLEALGGDCAGALAIVPEGGAASAEGRYEPLARDELDAMIERMPHDPLLLARDDLRLSLAGAQQKIPLYYEGGEFFLPRGAFPSSHILKPAMPGFPGIVANEAFCMELARQAGLPVPRSAVIAGKHPFYLVERYDRRREPDGKLARLHQEDLCQALGCAYARKYEADGGPGLKACFSLIAQRGTQPAADKLIMLRCAIFNYLIGNCDAHAKNFSMMITRSDYRLAPLYDLLSTRVYGSLSPKFAMRLGGQFRGDSMRKENWLRLAGDAGVGAKAVLELCGELGEAVPGLARRLAAAAAPEDGELLGRALKQIEFSAARLLKVL